MIGWIVVVFVVVGILYNIHKNRICFVVWGVGNLFWLYDFLTQTPIQWAYIFLIGLYMVFNVWGWRKWTKDAQERSGISQMAA